MPPGPHWSEAPCERLCAASCVTPSSAVRFCRSQTSQLRLGGKERLPGQPLSGRSRTRSRLACLAACAAASVLDGFRTLFLQVGFSPRSRSQWVVRAVSSPGKLLTVQALPTQPVGAS